MLVAAPALAPLGQDQLVMALIAGEVRNGALPGGLDEAEDLDVKRNGGVHVGTLRAMCPTRSLICIAGIISRN